MSRPKPEILLSHTDQDTYKKEEAVKMAEQARKKLMECYRQVNASVSGK